MAWSKVIMNMPRWRTTRTAILPMGFLVLVCLQVTQSAPSAPFSTEDDHSTEGSHQQFSAGGVSSDDDGNSAEDVHSFFVVPGTNREVPSRSPTVGAANSQLNHAALSAQQNRAKSMSAHSHFRIGRDSLEIPDPQSREIISSRVGHAAGFPKGSFSSQHLSFGRSDDDFDDKFDDNSRESDDDDPPYFGLGRRYQPEGYSYVPAKKLFIPPPARPSSQAIGKQMPQSISNPYIYSVDTSGEDRDDDRDDHFDDDDDDDDVKLFATNSIVNMRHDDTNEHRLAFNENTLRGFYNYVDGQGSRRWAYELDDQYQDHTVHEDGTMKGKYGWTAPDGHSVKIQYVADEGGFRVISSHGIYLGDDDDVEEARRHHLLAHKKAGSIIGSAEDDVTLFATGGAPLPGQQPGFGANGGGSVGVPLPGQAPGFGGTSGGFGGDPLSSQPGFGASGGSPGDAGVSLPGLETGGQLPDGAGLSPGLGGFGGSDDDTTLFTTGQGTGAPLPGAGSPSQGFGVDFQGPPSGTSGGSGSFGVPLPDPGAGGATTGGATTGGAFYFIRR
ncbi:uncharacterized protein LOC135224668 isoform X1 [Macrobrachium nipponense]|uniref:uncharacterized protein LOC135224668 isoform X1 n=1 Tax=Macrobrachium nipponense TaxID=159736 RepID=UPI0030C81B21